MILAVESDAATGRHRTPRWRRWLAHLFTTPLAVRRAFPAAVLSAIGAAIERAEAGHRGEIVFVAEGSLPWTWLLRHASVRRRALGLFSQLRVWDTEHNNGVLVYVGLADRAVEIVADRGLAARVGAQDWHRLAQDLRDQCRLGAYESGAIQAVRQIGAWQAAHFPLAPGEVRRNELSNRPLAL
jgi:hypothetical protein